MLDFDQILLHLLMLLIFMIMNLVKYFYSVFFSLKFIYYIDSCLGRYDGQVYEALMERARLNPTNRYKVKDREMKLRIDLLFFLFRFIRFGHQLNKIQCLNSKI